MWTYKSMDGEISYDDEFVGTGYSGNGLGRNNPERQSERNVGPIPKGFYTIGKAFDQIPGKGPCVMRLIPKEGTETFGRSGFMIHGDNKTHDASHGCIILGPTIRHLIANSVDRNLEVI